MSHEDETPKENPSPPVGPPRTAGPGAKREDCDPEHGRVLYGAGAEKGADARPPTPREAAGGFFIPGRGDRDMDEVACECANRHRAVEDMLAIRERVVTMNGFGTYSRGDAGLFRATIADIDRRLYQIVTGRDWVPSAKE